MEPYLFKPVFIEKIWGADNLARLLNKDLPRGKKIGESFEVSRRPNEESVVARGADAGKTLRLLIERDPVALLGPDVCDKSGSHFPLLLKFLDANDVLSVQVHPDDRYAAARGESDTGKEETWYVIEARTDARLFKGLLPDTTPSSFRSLLEKGRLEECLNSFTVKPGDVVHLPAGTVHAIGAGTVLAEIQRNSNITYRVYDWNRIGPDGKPRDLHIEQALDVIDWRHDLPDKNAAVVLQTSPAHHERLVDGDFYLLDSLRGASPFPVPRERNAFRILIVIAGHGDIRFPDDRVPYALGQSFLLPAALDDVELLPDDPTTVLLCHPV